MGRGAVPDVTCYVIQCPMRIKKNNLTYEGNRLLRCLLLSKQQSSS